MNVILGSGLIAAMAAHILKWDVISFGKSRYYSYMPALADDYVVYEAGLESTLNDSVSPRFHKIAFSCGGELFPPDDFLRRQFLRNLYGDEQNPALLDYLKPKTVFKTSCSKWCHYYVMPPQREIMLAVNRETIRTSNRTIEYDRMVSTIPLDALLGYMGKTCLLQALDVHFTLVRTKSLDFEGADEVLTVDVSSFFKVVHVGDGFYVFWSKEELTDELLNAYLDDFTVVNRTVIRRMLPKGIPPDLSELEKNGIYCVGSNAQWDDRMDVSSCIKRLLKIRG